jgi:hypothetical protein
MMEPRGTGETNDWQVVYVLASGPNCFEQIDEFWRVVQCFVASTKAPKCNNCLPDKNGTFKLDKTIASVTWTEQDLRSGRFRDLEVSYLAAVQKK